MRSDSLSELSSVLPAWVPWAGPILALVTFGAVYLVVRLILVDGALRAAERSDSWTERARHVHVARIGGALAVVLLPVIACFAAVVFVGPLAAVPRPVVILVLATIGATSAFLLSAVVDRYVHGPSEDGLLRSAFGAVISFAPVLALFVLGWFAPSELSSWAMVPWLTATVIVVRLWLRAALLLLGTPLAREADERTSVIVDRAAESLSMRVDRVIEFPTRQPNAFAFPWLNVLAFTTGLLECLDDEELDAITHHEIAHLSESAGLTRLRQAQLYAIIPIVATRPLLGTFGIIGPVAALVFFVAVSGIARRRGRAAEHASDSAAVESIHRSEVYALALEKTYRVGLIPAVLRRSTHGQLHERLRAAGVEPDFEIPAAPPRWRGSAALLAISTVFIGAWLSPWLASAVMDDESRFPTHLSATLPAYGSDALEWLATEAELDERWRDAAILYAAAADVRPDDGFLRSETTRLWAFAGECPRAELSIELLDPGADVDAFGYLEELIDWCHLTGGLP